MRKLMRWVAVLIIIFVFWLALVLSQWLPRPTAEEEAALAALRETPANVVGERDGFAAMWLIGYDVPQEDLDAVLKADIAAYDALLASTGSVIEFKTTANDRYPTVAAPNNQDPALCELWKLDCLARVRANREVTRQRLQDFAVRLRLSRRMGDYDHMHFAFSPRFDSPIPPFGGISNLQLAEVALQFVDGQRDEAFATLCRDTATWRRLRARSDILINDMVGVAQMSAAAHLYASMLAEQPGDFAPPCTETFAALTDAELDQCAAMRFEFLSSENSFEQSIEMIAPDGNAFARTLYRTVNQPHLVRTMARAVGKYCQAPHRARTLAREPAPVVADYECTTGGWLFDPAGCLLFQKALPSYDMYYHRVLDLDARLKLLSALVWLRTQPAANEATFKARPAKLDSPRHAFTWMSSGPALRMTNLETGRGEHWELPLSAPTSAQP